MFSKSDSSSSSNYVDQRKLRDEILHRNDRTNESGHNESFQNLFLNTQHNFLNDQKSTHSDNEITLNSIITEASTDVGMMAPQSICFIGDEEDVDEIERNVETMQCFSNNGSVMIGQRLQNIYKTDVSDVDGNKFNIKSGNLTYRIPSPSRPLITPNIFQDPQEKIESHETGFYIAFDDKQPKRPKPPLRTKRWSKKEKNIDSVDHQLSVKQEPFHQQIKVDDNDSKQNIFNNAKNLKNNNATYNKYTDAPVKSKQLAEISNHNPLMSNIISSDRRHLEDLTNQQQTVSPSLYSAIRENNNEPKGKALVIGSDVSTLDAESIDEMERKKEKIMLLSLQRRQRQEETMERKVIEENSRREREREKEEERVRKKEEQKARRAAILEQYRLKNTEREVELDRSELIQKPQSQSAAAARLRPKKIIRPRPKTIHVDMSEAMISSSRGKAVSTTNLTGYGQLSSNSMRRDYYKSSQDLLTAKKFPDDYPSARTSISIVRSDSTSREPTVERGRALSRISATKGNTLNFRSRKSNSLINLRDSGLGSVTPPRRIPSPGTSTSLSGRKSSSPYGPGSLPPGVIKRRGFDDGLNNMCAPNTLIEYSGPKLYKQPAAKSNRGIIFNAVEYCVFPGAVNRDAKQIVLEKIARSESKHFLVLFRDAGCQFRALYSYTPESNQVHKLYGTGPGQVDEVMFDKFFKYNSGGKCFSQVHTKHLTVTIDAFTIHNSLWQGKKIHLPSKKDMSLLI